MSVASLASVIACRSWAAKSLDYLRVKWPVNITTLEILTI
jgi:hypothetical protein